MKKLLGLVLSGMLTIGMVGCGADEVAEDAYNDAKDKVEEQTEPVEEPKDEVVEPEDIAPVEEEELDISKEEVAQLLKEIIGDSMGRDYEVEVMITDNGDCAIGIADLYNSYSGYDKSLLESMCKEAGLENSAMEIVRNAKLVFEEYDFEDVNVTLMLMGSDYDIFMTVTDAGYIAYY